MRYKVNDIHDDGLEIRVPVTAEWLTVECPGLDAQPGTGGLALTGRLERSGTDYLLRGQLAGNIQTACGRCLEPADLALDLPLAVSFVERDEDAEDDEEEAGGDVIGFSGHVIDVGPAIRDEILLALPIGPICRPDCKGICPTCGGNRNTVPCSCEDDQKRAQSKLADLGKLKV